jgi:hypothetical protein
MIYLPNISHDPLNMVDTKSAEFTKTRGNLLVKLTELGVQAIEIAYSAEDTIASVDAIAITPPTVAVSEDDMNCIGAFALQFSYSVTDGAEGDYQSCGALHWNVLKNKIDVHYTSYHIIAETETHRGL